jgi:hypothetical protein
MSLHFATSDSGIDPQSFRGLTQYSFSFVLHQSEWRSEEKSRNKERGREEKERERNSLWLEIE